MYFVKTPAWLKKIYHNYVWHIPTREKVVYLTFDDGPHPEATPFVLKELKKFDAKATFFCIGKNVIAEPEIYEKILIEGHSAGNHTHNHLNGWKSSNDIYIDNIHKAAGVIESKLFRPPYGRIKKIQGRKLKEKGFEIIMWDVLSGDFDTGITPEKCYKNVADNAVPGSVIVFHDSEKAFKNMSHALPKILHLLSGKGYRFEAISNCDDKRRA